MSQLKRLKPNRLTFTEGFNFGLGFFSAALVFSVIIVPALACGAFFILSAIGQL